MEFSARSRFLDISKSVKLYYLIAAGIIFCIISFTLYRNLLVTITMIISTILAYIILSRPPQNIKIRILEEGIDIDGSFIEWQNCYGFAVVDLGQDLEFIIRTSYLVKQFQYFYLEEDSKIAKDTMFIFNEAMEYDEEIPKHNQAHAFLRNFGLN